MAKIKVLLIEDNRLLREGTAEILNQQKDIRAVATAGTRSALIKAKKLRPDVVLLDIGLRSLNSMKVIESIRKLSPKTEFVVMDLLPNQTEVVKYVNAGVSGYIPKDSTVDQFLNTIREVVRGVKVLPPTATNSIFSDIVQLAIQDGQLEHVLAVVKFSKRERDIITLLALGRSQISIARQLKIVPYTIKNHIRSVLDKLALHSRLELAASDGA